MLEPYNWIFERYQLEITDKFVLKYLLIRILFIIYQYLFRDLKYFIILKCRQIKELDSFGFFFFNRTVLT